MWIVLYHIGVGKYYQEICVQTNIQKKNTIKFITKWVKMGLGLHVSPVYFSLLMSFLSCPIMLLCYNFN